MGRFHFLLHTMHFSIPRLSSTVSPPRGLDEVGNSFVYVPLPHSSRPRVPRTLVDFHQLASSIITSARLALQRYASWHSPCGPFV